MTAATAVATATVSATVTATAAATAARALCFAIGPYGAVDSETRKWSNFLFEKIIHPVLKDGYTVQRTIDDPEPGKITTRIERDLNEARLVVADLTSANPNVYFEMGFRHALNRPLVHIARYGTVLPFDMQDYNVIWVYADYVEPKGYFTISDDKLIEARDQLSAHLKKVDAAEPPRPTDPVAAKVYDWQMWYSPQIAADWLGKQSDSFKDEIARYERDDAADAISDASLVRFAEYQALKAAAAQNGEGTIFVTFDNHIKKLELGHAVFRFANVPDAVLINVKDVTCSDVGLSSIKFAQQSRAVSIERGGRRVNVTIPGYNYTLHVEPDPTSSDTAVGTIVHPHTRTSIGHAELRPKYGHYLR